MAPYCLIVEDHHLFADALQQVVGGIMDDLKFVHAASAHDARIALKSKRTIELVLLDLCLPDIDGFAGLLELRRLLPGTPVVVCSAFYSLDLIQTAILFGATGYIPKSEDRDTVKRVVCACRAGGVTIPEGYQLDADRPCLTRQQLHVLELVSQGLLNKQIAYKLNVSETTIKAHVGEILRKLDVSSRTQAVLKVVQTCLRNSWDNRYAGSPAGLIGEPPLTTSARIGGCHE